MVKKKITQVNFGGSVAIYIDGELACYEGGMFGHTGIAKFLAEHIHEDFEPMQFVAISDESTYWDTAGNFGSANWFPAQRLELLIEKLDDSCDMFEV